MFKIGDKVVVSSDNDCYDEFREKVLVIIHAYYSTEDHPGYDNIVDGMGLYELSDEDGNEIDSLLYEYELDYV